MKKQIVFLATAWGTKHGGINSFNFDLCKAVAAQLQPLEEYEVVCVVLNADKDVIEKAQKDNNIRLISLDISPRENFEDGDAYKIRYIFEDRNSSWQPCWWVGHDVISGSIAIKLRELHKKLPSKVVIIRHMDYETYKIFQNPTESEELIQEQKRITKDANRVIAIGPYLQNLVQDYLDTDVKCLIPGLLKNVQSKTSPKTFRAITFGRLEPATKVIKQTELTVKAFGVLIKRSHELEKRHLNNAILTLVGIKKDSSQSREMLEIAKEYAGRSVTVNCFAYQELREELIEELSRKAVCLMLSLREGFGLAGWEAISAEVPLVLSKSSGLYQFLESLEVGATRRVIGIDVENKEEVKNIDKISQHLLAISENPKKYKEQAQELKKILEVYTWERAANDFLEALEIQCHKTSQFGEKPVADVSTDQTLLDILDERIDLMSPYHFDSAVYREETVFRGRHDEQEWLKEQFDEALQSSKSRTILIKGERGIGKTRVIHVFAEKLIEEHEAYVVIRDFENEYFEAKMFPQLTVDLCSLYKLADLSAYTQTKHLKEIGNTILGEKTDDKEMTGTIETASLFLKLLQELAQQHPLVIIFENLSKAPKWAIEFFEKAALKPGKFLLIGTVRLDPEKFERIRASKSKELKGLSCYDGRALVDSLYSPSSLHDDFYQRLIERTQGNPFFILEVMEYLKEERIIQEQEGKWAFQEDLEVLPCWTPESLQDFVSRKLAPLDKSTEENIKMAAVIGPRFLHRLLYKVARYNDLQVDESIRIMIRQGLIKTVKNDDEDMLPGSDNTYYFQPQIIQEVLYEENSNPQLHLTIAQFLEELYQDKKQERLQFWCAYHYLLSKNADKALPFLENLIRDKQLPFESIWLLKRTLEKFASSLDSSKEVKLRRNLAQKYSEVGRLDDAFENYQKARKIAVQGKAEYEQPDQDEYNELNILAADLTVEMGWIRVKQAQFEPAEILFQEAVERLDKAIFLPEWLPIKVYRLYGGLFLEQLTASPKQDAKITKIIHNALKYTHKAKNLVEQCKLFNQEEIQRHKVLVLNNLGRIQLTYGNFFQKGINSQQAIPCYEKARGYFQTALNLANRKITEDLSLKAYIYNNLGCVAEQLREYSDAIDLYKESLKNTDREENVFLRAKSLQNLASVYMKQMNFKEMEIYAEEALWYAKLLEHSPYQYRAYRFLGLAYKQEGRWKEALTLFEQAETLYSDESNRRIIAEITAQLKTKEEIYGNKRFFS